MPTVKEMRALIDQTLDRWEAAASALEANAEASSAALADRVEAFKGKAAEASESLKQAVAQAQKLPSEARDSIATGLDHLKVQLALGKAEAHDAMVNQKQQISAASEFFDEVLEKGSLEELTIPITLEAISKAYGSRYSLLLYFRPEYIYTNPSRWGAYPIGSGGVLNLKSNNFYLMLLDVENSNVIFFGKAKGKNYRAYIPELLKEINISSKS